MTIEEAIEILKEEHDWAQLLSYVNGALELAIKALEKQIPKTITDIHCDEYYCPNCGAENLCDQYLVTDKFCPNCGQRLELEKESEIY